MIDIYIKDNLFNEFNPNDLSMELANYVEQQTKLLPINKKIKLVFHYQGNDQKMIKEIIKSYYQRYLDYYLKLDKVDDKKRIVLFLIGILLIIISRMISFPILNEILLISGWVAIWELTYDLLFNNQIRKSEIKRCRSLVNSEIEFI